jgi:hypothetical protein
MGFMPCWTESFRGVKYYLCDLARSCGFQGIKWCWPNGDTVPFVGIVSAVLALSLWQTYTQGKKKVVAI